MSIEEPSGDERSQLSFTMVDQPLAQQMIKALVSAPTITTIAAIKSKENFTSSLVLTSVTGVKNLNTSPVSV